MVLLSCKYSKSITVNLDLESKSIKEHYKNEQDGQLHYSANVSFYKTGRFTRTLVHFEPNHNLKLIPR